VLESDRLEDGRGVVVFIHGLWLHAESWQRWVDLFDGSGYDCVAAPWPGESSTVAACRADPAPMAGVSLAQLCHQVATVIGTLAKPPVLIGHGVGGLIARTLLGRTAVSAAIAIAPMPAGRAGIRSVVAVRGLSQGLGAIRDQRRATMPTAAQFHRRFANAVGQPESDELYRRFVIPAGGRPLLNSVLASSRPHRGDHNGEVTRRGPLLLISGSRDALISERWTGALQRHYRRTSPDQVSDHQVFPGRGHSMVIDARWRDVAYYCLDWLTRQNL
jgi:non-heme chloroperoxidase